MRRTLRAVAVALLAGVALAPGGAAAVSAAAVAGGGAAARREARPSSGSSEEDGGGTELVNEETIKQMGLDPRFPTKGAMDLGGSSDEDEVDASIDDTTDDKRLLYYQQQVAAKAVMRIQAIASRTMGRLKRMQVTEERKKRGVAIRKLADAESERADGSEDDSSSSSSGAEEDESS